MDSSDHPADAPSDADDLQPLSALKLRRDLLPQQVAQHLMREIIKGHLKPGQRLPNERDLARTLGVGRPTVREAIRGLQMMNVLRVRQGEPTRVAELTPEALIEPFELMCQAGAFDIRQLFEVRVTLESGIAGLAAERISDAHLKKLETCLERSRSTLDDAAEFAEADIELHTLVVEASGNPIFTSLMAAIGRLGRASRQYTSQVYALRAVALQDHEKIIHAMRRRDREAATQAMAQHIHNVANAYFDTLRRAGGPFQQEAEAPTAWAGEQQGGPVHSATEAKTNIRFDEGEQT